MRQFLMGLRRGDTRHAAESAYFLEDRMKVKDRNGIFCMCELCQSQGYEAFVAILNSSCDIDLLHVNSNF